MGLGEEKGRDVDDSCQFPISGVDMFVQIPGQALSSAPANLAAESCFFSLGITRCLREPF